MMAALVEMAARGLGIMSKTVKAVRGQATVELCVAIPVLIAVAVVSINVLTFLSECALYDRQFNAAVLIHASSPDAGQDIGAVCADIERDLRESFSDWDKEVSVSAQGASDGMTVFNGTLTFTPSFIGRELRGDFFGIELPQATHTCSFSVLMYKTGVLF